MLELIHKAFNTGIDKSSLPENDYTPEVKVSSTVVPDEDYSYNEVFKNINEQLKLKL